MFNGKSILITGGTGNFGNSFTQYLLDNYSPKNIVIYSRDEHKQSIMFEKFKKHKDVLKFIIGDIRDKERLSRAFEGVDYVVHAAAMSLISSCEYNYVEAVKTNINGAINVIEAALNTNVTRVVALSTDKAVNPINVYGGTKLVSDRLFIATNANVGERDLRFSVVRYGNVAGSEESFIPYFKDLIEKGNGALPVNDYRMTRFWIGQEESMKIVVRALCEAIGGEIFVAKIPSYNIVDLAKAIAPDCALTEVGMQEGEKLHENMIGKEDAKYTYEYDDYYIIYPQFSWFKDNMIIPGGKKVTQGFEYESGSNSDWLTVDDIQKLLKKL